MTPTEQDKELREQINAIRERLVGRNQTHQQVARLSKWTRIELENVIKEDSWIYEDEMIALIQAHTNAEIARTLDRLEAQYGETIDNTLGKPIRIQFVSVKAIQAERAKLKEVK